MLGFKLLSFSSKNKLLTLILLAAAILRFVGTNPSYNQFHSDEGITYSAASSMILNKNLDPLRYDYPAVVPLVNYIFFQNFFIPISWYSYYSRNIQGFTAGTTTFPVSDKEIKKVFSNEILGYREMNALFWSRYVTALFGLGNVILLYLIASRLFNKNIGLISALLLTFNFKHVQNSHIGLPDIYNSFFLLLSLFFTLKLMKDRSWRNYLMAGVGMGLSFSTKYQIFSFLPFMLIYFFNTVSFKGVVIKKTTIAKAIISFLVVLLVFIVLNPYFFINIDKAVKAFEYVSSKYAMGRNTFNLYPLYYFFHIDYGPIEFFAIIIGVVLALVKYTRSALILFSLAIPFLYVFLYYSIGGFYVRNFISITPILLVFAAVSIWQLYKFLILRISRVYAKILILLFIFLTIFIPAKNAVINSYYSTKPWNYDLIRAWEQKNLPKDSIVASHPFDPVPDWIKRSEFLTDGNFSLAEHNEAGATHALINLDWAGNTFYFWMIFGFEKLEFLNKPIDLMRNTYFGLASEELFRYQIFSAVKPWQAPDADLVLAKLPAWPSVEMKKINEFNFDNDLEKWNIYGKEDSKLLTYKFDSHVGNLKLGSITLIPNSTKPAIRITSLPIRIKPGYLYKVSAFLKSEKLLDSKYRDGFLRIDFYEKSTDLEKVGIISSVSSRVFGTDQWIEKKIVERAPSNSQFLTVSFQVVNAYKLQIWMDDVKVEESLQAVENITDLAPFHKNDIQLDLLYPNSHGNL